MFSELNKTLGIKLFNIPNVLNYILFDKIYSFFVLKKKNIDDEILKFHHNGYIKTKHISLKLANFVNENIISKQEKDIQDGSIKHQFKVDENYREIILELIKNDYGSLISNLEKYYNNSLAILEFRIKRNFPITESDDYYKKKNRDKTREPYSNYFHVDYYVGTYFKMFINLQDVYEDNGPLNIYDIQSSKKFVKENNYKNRNNYIVRDFHDKLYVNTGKKGETVIAQTTKCLHRAGNVKNNKRDIILITFGAIPEKTKNKDFVSQLDYYEKQNPDDLWFHTGRFTKLSKPKNLRSTFKLLSKFIKSKIN